MTFVVIAGVVFEVCADDVQGKWKEVFLYESQLHHPAFLIEPYGAPPCLIPSGVILHNHGKGV